MRDGNISFSCCRGSGPERVEEGSPQPLAESSRSPHSPGFSPENPLTIFGCRKNIKAENVEDVVLSSVVLLVWMKKQKI